MHARACARTHTHTHTHTHTVFEKQWSPEHGSTIYTRHWIKDYANSEFNSAADINPDPLVTNTPSIRSDQKQKVLMPYQTRQHGGLNLTH